MSPKVVALMSVMAISLAACGESSSPRVDSAIENSSASEPAPVATSPVVAATTTTIATPLPTSTPAVVTVPPTTSPPPLATVAPDPHGVPIETGCIRADIDFDAVRVAAGVTQPEVGRIPPATCNVLIYATGTDGRIAWLEIGIGDIFGWSAQSNFVQSSFAPSPVSTPAGGAVATTFPPAASPPVAGAALDFAAQTVFGFGVGYVSLDQAVSVITAQLGPLTTDTGWLPEVPADPEDGCTGSPPTRLLSWGDLTIEFFQVPGPGSSAALTEYLDNWSVGDRAVLSLGFGVGTSGAAPTGLHTADGIGIGSTIAAVTAAYGAEFQFSLGNGGGQAAYGNVNPATSIAVALLAVSGRITGIGTAVIAC